MITHTLNQCNRMINGEIKSMVCHIDEFEEVMNYLKDNSVTNTYESLDTPVDVIIEIDD